MQDYITHKSSRNGYKSSTISLDDVLRVNWFTNEEGEYAEVVYREAVNYTYEEAEMYPLLTWRVYDTDGLALLKEKFGVSSSSM